MKIRLSMRRRFVAAATSIMIAALMLGGCRSRSGLPKPSTPQYAKLVSAFYVGLSALQVGDDPLAQSKLREATEIAPGEPASWADWGILALREHNFELAAQRLNRARKLAPKNSQMYYLLGLLSTTQGNSQPAIKSYQEAVRLNPTDLRAVYALAREIERQQSPGYEQKFQKLIEQILAAQPDNLAALLELSRISAKQGESAALHSAVNRIAAQSADWPADIKQQLVALQKSASGADVHAAATRSIFLHNVLMQLPSFRADLSKIRPAPGVEAQPFTHFLRLPSPASTPAPPDMQLTFTPQAITMTGSAPWKWIGAVSLTGKGPPAIVVANAHEVKLSTGAVFPFPGGPHNVDPSPESILPGDFNYDFKTDLVLAGAGGLRFMRQDNGSHFTDVTAQTRLPRSILDAAYTGAWAVDVDSDGDLDIVLGQPSGLPTVLRNNGDGTFTPIHPFVGISGIRQFAWADLNQDDIPDAALIDGSGHLHVFFNDRFSKFTEQKIPAGFSSVQAITIADIHNVGRFDILAVLPGGAIDCLAGAGHGQSWTVSQVAAVPDPAMNLSGEVRLHASDIDNNGAIDLFLAQLSPLPGRTAGGLIWLADQKHQLHLMNKPVGPARAFQLADVRDNGRLAILGLTPTGQPLEELNHGTKHYHWQTIRPRARRSTGDQRVNPFGIGGEIEIRSALLTQKLPITSPQLHFGLGAHTETDVARIIWPNGSVRADFALKADQEVLTEQRLKGSCPFLFAWNGKEMAFVQDTVPWGSAIGLRINSLGSAAIAATTEWFKIPGRELKPHNGYYDLRITGELWEAFYYDYLSLMVVDHPAGTAVFTDGRFVIPPVKLAITATGIPHPVARAIDDNGKDVTSTINKLDGKYLANFGLGQYQGITRDHYVQLDLGKDIPTKGPLYLIATGWIHPADSTIVTAISQGHHEQPKPLSLSVEDDHGVWHVVEPNLGFPAGKNKTCLINLTGLFRPGMPHRVRLSTNLEIYWDQIQWAQGLPNTPLRITRLAPSVANLHYRGYSVLHKASVSSPEIPAYNHLLATTQIWRDLPGYYTRYGDVRQLLRKIDNRYVIMNAGDELTLHFTALPPPPAGWVRDYVIDGDGWVKDGDYNSIDSATVLPLPYHARKLYNTPPRPLQEEWVYRHHAGDWQTYQTRYVSDDQFDHALRSSPNP